MPTLTSTKKSNNTRYQVDTTAATVSSDAITTATGSQNTTLNAGDVVYVSATLRQPVSTLFPYTTLFRSGGTTVQATYDSGSGSTQLVFKYTILAGQNDSNGISIDANIRKANV